MLAYKKCLQYKNMTPLEKSLWLLPLAVEIGYRIEAFYNASRMPAYRFIGSKYRWLAVIAFSDVIGHVGYRMVGYKML